MTMQNKKKITGMDQIKDCFDLNGLASEGLRYQELSLQYKVRHFRKTFSDNWLCRKTWL